MTNGELFDDLKQSFTTSVSLIEQRLKIEAITVTEKELKAVERQLLANLSRFADTIEFKRQSGE